MYITIAGGGRIGRGLAKRLVEGKHDVVIIDQDKSVCEAIYSEYGAVTINGNATNLDVLENAGVEQSDIAIAVMRNDSDNLTFALLAKNFEIPNIHVRMNDPKYESVYKSVGVTNIARVSDLLIDQFTVNIETPELRKVVGLGDLDIVIANVPKDALADGTRVKELAEMKGFPQTVVVVCVFEDASGVFTVARGDTQIHGGDRLFLCGEPKEVRAVAKMLSKQ